MSVFYSHAPENRVPTTSACGGSTPLLTLRDVTKLYPVRGQPGATFRAVDGVSLAVYEGEALGLVGESGCGKSTLGRIALRLIEPSSGAVFFSEQDVRQIRGRTLLQFRRQAQIVFQDPFSSLNPRMTIRQILREPLRIHQVAPGHEDQEVGRLLEQVGLRPDHADRYPFEFSGGQRQRISIARAIAPRPRLIVADEPVSSLDVSVQAQILTLLRELQRDLRVAMLFVSHNLAVVRTLCQRTAVMRQGKIVEEGATARIFDSPQHEYTRLLLKSVLDPVPSRWQNSVITSRQT